jgi:S-formylglutathione hydrolase FrmB
MVQGPERELPIYLGYGRSDRFADGLQLMAEAMPAAIHHTIDGDHDWPTWQALWQDFVARHNSAETIRGTH